MRIAIINITASGMSRGYKKYLINILPWLASSSNIESILCVSPKKLCVNKWFKPMQNVEFIAYSYSKFFRYGINNKILQKINQFSPELVFIPVEKPFKFNNIPTVTMIQNMEPLAYNNEGNPLSEKLKNLFRYYYAKKAVKKSNRVIAISEFVKEYLIEQWHISEDKIGLVYHGIDIFKQDNVIKPLKLSADWSREFIFTAGSIRPARGLEDILEAILLLNNKGNKGVNLVIAGDVIPNMVTYQNKLKAMIKKMGISDRVFWVDHLNVNEMSWCYQNCKVFIMSSRVESFGQIALEAMSQGCVCVSADNPCLPEVFKNAALYYSPRDSQSLAEVIKYVFSWDSTKRADFTEIAENRASDFSWDVCTKRTVEELKKARHYLE
jgi:glycosyltransferase involved in cell wall biosynthesis